MSHTPRTDALLAQWDDDGSTRGSAFIELRDLARDLERENAELRRLAQASLDARDKEARAEMVWDSAGANYSIEGLKRAARERDQAMVAASKADKALRDALVSAPHQPDSGGKA